MQFKSLIGTSRDKHDRFVTEIDTQSLKHYSWKDLLSLLDTLDALRIAVKEEILRKRDNK